ncbi:MAG: HTH domain-containing protein [Verrucomicrobia bacterium]|nr:HTH domain-containing protein [Verrucomicrobiota bacterium]
MSALSATERILLEAGSRLSCREIASLALERGYWQSSGKTPWATVGAQLYTDIHKLGAASRFVQVGPDCFSLNPSRSKALPAVNPKQQQHQAKALKKLSFTQAAEKILATHGKKEPMHYREVTRKALELGLLDTEGQTPEATMYAQILTEIRRYRVRGEQSRFVQHGGGFVSLSAWMGKGLAFDIEQHNRKMRADLLKRLIAMGATEFEHFISELLAKVGFEGLKVTPPSKDGGIDVRGVLVVGEVIRTKMAVQVKKWGKQNVQAPQVQQVRGSLGAHEQGLIITTSDFSKGAQEEATRSDAVPVALMNGEQLVALMVAHEVMVARRSHDILELDDGAVGDVCPT